MHVIRRQVHWKWLAVEAAVVAALMSGCPQHAGAYAEISGEDAVKAARKFMKAAGLNPDESPQRVTNAAGIPGWVVSLGDYQVQVDADTGKPVVFSNYRRLYEIIHNIGRTGKKRFANRDAAEVFARKLAAQLGLPSGWKLDRLDFGSGKAAQRGEVRASFCDRRRDYPFIDKAGGGSGMDLTLDAQDGVLKGWTITTVVTDSPKLRQSRTQAIAAAQQAYQQYYKGRRSFHGGPLDAAHARLGYSFVQRFSKQSPPHARLVWSVPFGGERVWVDAETGQTDVAAMK